MIDFKNGSSIYSKLKAVSDDTYASFIVPMFTEGESILGTFKESAMVLYLRTKELFQ